MAEYRHILALICELHPSKSQSKHDEWLKMFLRRDDYVNNSTGRGVRAVYGYTAATYLALIVELNALGISPMASAKMLKAAGWEEDWTVDYITLQPIPNSRSKIVIDLRRIKRAIEKIRKSIEAIGAGK